MSRIPAPRRRDALRLLLALALLVGWLIFGRASFEDEIQAAQRSADRLDCATAERELQRASNQAEGLSGADPRFAEALQSLARCWGGHGRYGEAESHLERALAIHRRMPGGDLPGVAGVLHGLGWLAARGSRYAEAEVFYREALAIHERIRQGTLARHPLGALAARLPVRLKALPSEHPYVGSALDDLGSVYRAQARLDLAEQAYERAVRILDRALPPAHPQRASAHRNLLALCRDSGGIHCGGPIGRTS